MPGLDKKVLDSIDHELALSRIARDVRSDFILAPHYNAIFLRAGAELWDNTHRQLKSGTYEPELALTIPVPKPRGFTRPGSILQPADRLVYQALADLTAPILEAQLDRTRSFSHVLLKTDDAGHMFEPEGPCWDRLQKCLTQLAGAGGYFVKADVANYFERIPQHHLINLMLASGCQSEVVRLLEEMLLAFQERDSFGIVQGVFPSDLLGNFYLSDLDAYCEIHDIPSARFVDDVFLHFSEHGHAAHGLMQLIDRLRHDGLHLNEFKSGIRTAEELIREETELDRLFSRARDEIEAEKEETEEIEFSYGFAPDWELEEEGEEEEEVDIATAAVIRLYESIEDFPEQSDKIERFCLPVLQAGSSQIAIDRALDGVVARPHLTSKYMPYLSRFVPESHEIVRQLESLLSSKKLTSDYQRMYLLAGLMKAKKIEQDTVKVTLQILGDARFAQPVRALAAIFGARHGTPQQRRAVRVAYENEASPYVRSAILYASRHFTNTERKVCVKAWGGHSAINALVAHALRPA